VTNTPTATIAWFTEKNANQIGELNVSTDTITEVTLPAGGSPQGITGYPIVGPIHADVWFTETPGSIGNLTYGDSTAYLFPVPTAGASPNGITPAGGNFWFTESHANQIGEYEVGNGNTILEFAAGSAPVDITSGPNGNLWFTEASGKIGVFNPGSQSVVAEYSVGGTLHGIVEGPDGNMWFTAGNKIGAVLPSVPNPQLASVNEDAGASAPVTVSALLTDGSYSDPDPGAVAGAAIVSAAGPGDWQYSLNSGTTWLAVGAVSDGAARLLPGSALVRFLPGLHQFGTATLGFRGWDETAGSSGSLLDATTNGGASAFSTAVVAADLAVNHVNHAPTWLGTAAGFSPVLPGNPNPPGDTITSVFGKYFSDIDPNTTVGVAVTALSGISDRTWQYSTNGGTTWTSFGNVSTNAARLLSGSDLIRFVPNAGFVGTVTLQAHAWDGSSGSDGGAADIAGTSKAGGSTAFSTASLIANLLVNTAPVLG
jgi:hypothetical protein